MLRAFPRSARPSRRAPPLLPLALFLALVAGSPGDAGSLQIGLSFTGSRFGVDSTSFPPDTMGAVGPSHVAEILNGRYSVYRKSDGVRVQTSTLNQFWTSAGQLPTGSSFDPRILYDAASQRWFAVAVDNARAANNILVAVSSSDDPTQGWTAFKVDSDATDSNWADFPTLGVDADAVVVAATMFPIGSSSLPVATDVLVLPKADLVAAVPSAGQRTLFENAAVGFQAQPVVDLDGGGMPTTLLSASVSPLGLLLANTLTGPAVTPTLGPPQNLPIAGLPTPPPADQPGPKANLDSGDARFGSNVVLQGGSVWAVQSVAFGGRAAIRWLRFEPGTSILLESGLIGDAALDFSYPSIAVNDFGDIVIGMSASGANLFPSAYAVRGRHGNGSTSFEDPILLQAGVSDYQRLGGDGRNRWGDYSATVLDPTDPLAFWTFQEYVSASNVWAVQITQLVVPEPGTAALLAVGLVMLVRRRPARVAPGTAKILTSVLAGPARSQAASGLDASCAASRITLRLRPSRLAS